MATKAPKLQDDSSVLDLEEPVLTEDELEKVKTKKSERQEFFLPFTGFSWYYPEEMRIVDHPAFQRLGRVNQLGQAHLVYRGATHKRFEHVLGVVALSQRMISTVKYNSEKITGNERSNKKALLHSAPISETEERFIRLAALLHDIGHIAAGHTIEDELELVGKHDADKRISYVFRRKNWDDDPAGQSETLEELVNRLYRKYVPSSLSAVSPANIARLMIRKPAKPGEDDFANDQKKLEDSSEIRLNVCSTIVANTICADLLDYIYRDWYHIGKQRSFDDRIFQYMEIRRKPEAEDLELTALPAPASKRDEFVIALGEKARVRTDGVSAILGLLEWRYELAETVLFHRTKLAAGAMLDRALYELWSHLDEDELIEKIILLSDEQLIDEAITYAKNVPENNKNSAGAQTALDILRRLKNRKLYKLFNVRGVGDLSSQCKTYLTGLYNDTSKGRKITAKARNETARLIEEDCELPTGSVAIYGVVVKPKIAQVKIAVGETISEFSEYEQNPDTKHHLSGGHLDAQIARFKSLWKLMVFVEAEAYSKLDRSARNELKSHIEAVVFTDTERSLLEHTVREKAELKFQRMSPARKNSIQYVPDLPDVASGDETVAGVKRYPNGAPSRAAFLRNFSGN